MNVTFVTFHLHISIVSEYSHEADAKYRHHCFGSIYLQLSSYFKVTSKSSGYVEISKLEICGMFFPWNQYYMFHKRISTYKYTHAKNAHYFLVKLLKAFICVYFGEKFKKYQGLQRYLRCWFHDLFSMWK